MHLSDDEQDLGNEKSPLDSWEDASIQNAISIEAFKAFKEKFLVRNDFKETTIRFVRNAINKE